MIVTPFGDLSWDDKQGLDSWFAAHAQRHRMEDLVIKELYGIPLSGMPLDIEEGKPGPEFFGRHMIAHAGMIRFMNPDNTVGAIPLESPWTTPDNFYRWHEIHNLLHSRLDRALGLQ